VGEVLTPSPLGEGVGVRFLLLSSWRGLGEVLTPSLLERLG